WDRHAGTDEHATLVSARAGPAPEGETVTRYHHGRPGVGELDPLARCGEKRNPISIRDVAEEIARHFLAANLVAVVVDGHQQEGRERVGLFLALPLGVLPVVGLERKALEIVVVGQLAITVVVGGKRAP